MGTRQKSSDNSISVIFFMLFLEDGRAGYFLSVSIAIGQNFIRALFSIPHKLFMHQPLPPNTMVKASEEERKEKKGRETGEGGRTRKKREGRGGEYASQS